jgi:glutamine synthetase adenylyltransferase
MFAINLSPWSTGETLDPDTFADVDGHAATQAMIDTADPEKLYSGMSLRALAEASNPNQISEHLRARLEQLSPQFLEKMVQWAEADNIIR